MNATVDTPRYRRTGRIAHSSPSAIPSRPRLAGSGTAAAHDWNGGNTVPEHVAKPVGESSRANSNPPAFVQTTDFRGSSAAERSLAKFRYMNAQQTSPPKPCIESGGETSRPC
jgi:hypothetical protein